MRSYTWLYLQSHTWLYEATHGFRMTFLQSLDTFELPSGSKRRKKLRNRCSNRSNGRKLLRRSAKPYLASQSICDYFFLWTLVPATTAGSHTIEGLQPVVQQSTVCPTSLEALRSQTWLRKIDARNCVVWLITKYINTTSCVLPRNSRIISIRLFQAIVV